VSWEALPFWIVAGLILFLVWVLKPRSKAQELTLYEFLAQTRMPAWTWWLLILMAVIG
jgi:ABC-type multidrug transport system permease subunit